MKKSPLFVLLFPIFTLIINLSSCKPKQNDAAIKLAIESSIKADSLAINKFVIVENGIATITGDCNDENCISYCANLVASISGVKKVVNNCTIKKQEIVATTPDDVLIDALNNVLKSNSGISGYVEHGKYIISGKIEFDKWLALREVLDKLKPSGYKLDGLTIN